MADAYESLSKEALIEILRRRDAQARYGLQWERRDIAPDRALNRDFVGLSIEPDLCAGPTPWSNLVIEGDNYDALRVLATHYAGRFKLIYIDPPYNTGRKDFVYNDHFLEPTDRFRHSTWLEFMYQRLLLARDLLAPDGAIFVSIDDNEVFNLGLLMNRVFGEASFVANCIWQKRYSRENNSPIGNVHEYLLVYSPNPASFRERRGRLPLDEKSRKPYRNPNNDPRGPWRLIPMTGAGLRPNQQYKVTTPSGRKLDPPEGRHWSVLEPEFERLRSEGRVSFGAKGDSAPGLIRYLSEVDGLVPWTWWPHEEVGHTDEARKEIQAFFGTQTAFDTPKPVRLMRRVLEIGAPEKDALCLDFFGGSGTFAQAVLEMNRDDGGNRRFVLVSSREATESAPDKNICRDVCAARLKKVVTGYRPVKGDPVPGVGSGFAYAVARTLPVHRLEDALTDEMVWSWALLAADHPLVPHPDASPASSHHRGHTVHYLSKTTATSLTRLAEELASRSGPATVYTWAPTKTLAFLGELSHVSVISVPDALATSFRRGNAQFVDRPDDAAVITEARAPTSSTDDVAETAS